MKPFAAILLSCCGLAAAVHAAPPNVLFIAVDDLRPELGCYGQPHIHSPHIDRLASQGRLFRNHYVGVPTCGAARHSMMTGQRPTSATDDNDAFVNHMPSTLPAEPESWADLLRRNGWRTVSLGKVSHEPDGYRWNFPSSYDIGRSSATAADMRHSWDEILFGHDRWGAQRYPLFAYADGTGRVSGVSSAWEVGVDGEGQSLPDEAYPDGQMAQAAIEKLREFADDGTRFCLAVGFFKPHLPFNAPKDYWDLYNPATLPAPSPLATPAGANPETTVSSGEFAAYTGDGDRAKLRHAYFACVSYIDAQVGKVLAELETLGLAGNTVVILWGDHGYRLNDYGTLGKHALLERALESPLIIRPPSNLRPEVFAGVPAAGLVETIDIYPTIAELCGLHPPASAAGSSLVPMLRNPFAPGKNQVFSRWGSLTSIRTPGWRLINTSGDYDLYDLSTFRYELEDVSALHPEIVSALSANLTVQGTRPGISYSTWAGGNPLLINPDGDGDGDGISNQLEYGAGSNALDPADKPEASFAWKDLEAVGFGDGEPVFSYTVASDHDDITLLPSTSTDLLHWSFEPLEFIDATDIGNSMTELRFRSADKAARRFFRLETGP